MMSPTVCINRCVLNCNCVVVKMNRARNQRKLLSVERDDFFFHNPVAYQPGNFICGTTQWECFLNEINKTNWLLFAIHLSGRNKMVDILQKKFSNWIPWMCAIYSTSYLMIRRFYCWIIKKIILYVSILYWFIHHHLLMIKTGATMIWEYTGLLKLCWIIYKSICLS